MGTKLPESARRAMRAFCLIGSIVFLVSFLSEYLGYYGLSLDPILHETKKLLWLVYDNYVGAPGSGLCAGLVSYLAAREKEVGNGHARR